MASVSQLFSTCPDLSSETSSNGLLLVRPLLEFSKEDMYKVCFFQFAYLEDFHSSL